MKIAPGIHRIGGTSMINAYLIEQAGEVTIIDAGVSGFYKDIDKELAAMGRTPAVPAKVVRAPSAFRPAWGGPTVRFPLVPASSRSSAGRSACSFSAFRQKSGSGTVRDGSSVFGGTNRGCPPTRWRV
jgi:hypothetical protein